MGTGTQLATSHCLGFSAVDATPKCIGFIRHLPCDNPCGGLLAKVSWERIQLGRARSPLQLLQSGVVVVFNINLSLGSANHRTNRHADDIQLQMFFGAFNARVMQGGEMLKVLQYLRSWLTRGWGS